MRYLFHIFCFSLLLINSCGNSGSVAGGTISETESGALGVILTSGGDKRSQIPVVAYIVDSDTVIATDTTHTDENGKYCFKHLQDGFYHFEAKANINGVTELTYTTAVSIQHLEEGVTIPTATMAIPAKIRGQLSASVTIGADTKIYLKETPYRATVKSDGSYTFNEVPANLQFTLVADIPSTGKKICTVPAIKPGDASEINIVFGDARSVLGKTIMFDGNPAPAGSSVFAELITGDRASVVATTQTDNKGNYIFRSLVAGEYHFLTDINSLKAYSPLINLANGNDTLILTPDTLWIPAKIIGGIGAGGLNPDTPELYIKKTAFKVDPIVNSTFNIDTVPANFPCTLIMKNPAYSAEITVKKLKEGEIFVISQTSTPSGLGSLSLIPAETRSVICPLTKKQVTFSSDFLMDTTEVTQLSLTTLLSKHYPTSTDYVGQKNGDTLPANGVTWYTAALYCNARSKEEGLDTVYTFTGLNGYALGYNGIHNHIADYANATEQEILSYQLRLHFCSSDTTKNGYRLPTAAEWAFASNAGQKTAYFWGEEGAAPFLNQFSWNRANMDKNNWTTPAPAGDGLQGVGQLKHNQYGLNDVYGNVGEWLHDGIDTVINGTNPVDSIAVGKPFYRAFYRMDNIFPDNIFKESGNYKPVLPFTYKDWYFGFRVVRKK